MRTSVIVLLLLSVLFLAGANHVQIRGKLRNGEIIAFRNLGSNHVANHKFLDAYTVDGRVYLSPTTTGHYTGTHWRVHVNRDGSYSFECLGNKRNAQHRFLDGRTADGSMGLAPNTHKARWSGTRWRVVEHKDGSYTFKCLGTNHQAAHRYLDGRTADGSMGLAPNHHHNPFSGTHWKLFRLSNSHIVHHRRVGHKHHGPVRHAPACHHCAARGHATCHHVAPRPVVHHHHRPAPVCHHHAAPVRHAPACHHCAAKGHHTCHHVAPRPVVHHHRPHHVGPHHHHHGPHHVGPHHHHHGPHHVGPHHHKPTHHAVHHHRPAHHHGKPVHHHAANGLFRQGSVIALRNLGSIHVPAHKYLDAYTIDGRVYLSPNTRGHYTSTHWRVHVNKDHSISLESLGDKKSAQHRFLDGRTADGTVGLAPNTHVKNWSGTRWAVKKLNNGAYAFRCLGTNHQAAHQWLDGRTAQNDGSVHLAPNHNNNPYSGTHWHVSRV